MRCSSCGSHDLDPIGETSSLNLYAHTDNRYQCQECGEIRVHGHAEDPEEGFRFYLPASQLVADRPECPDHGCDMWACKLRPDAGEYGVVQYKCPECELISSRELRKLSR